MTPSFTQTTLSGLSIANPSSLQFGPDGRLYIAQDNGTIVAVGVTETPAGEYTVTSREAINLVRFIPNHNDDGSFNATLTTRQVTGLLVAGTAERPVLYVSSSDPRIGGGTNKGDTGLDTNSGTLSRLTKDAGGNWIKEDLVYGLPRSEENHAVNGMQINPENGHLLLTVGGGTNAGAPSQEFGYLSDYAYGASIVDIDLAAISALPSQTYRGQTYKYALPTVDDPTRGSVGDVLSSGQPEVFGGNNGLNQARLTADSPVQIYANGFRNMYDITVGEDGHIYGIDNGGNPGWGGPPLYVQPDGTLGSTPTAFPTNAVNDGNGSINKAPLHLIERGYYGGHPIPVLANPTGAGLYRPDGTPVPLPADWPPVPASMVNPVTGYYLPPGVDRASLLPLELQTPLNLRGELGTFTGSVNGIDDYRSNAFDGEMKGDLIAASLNDDSIYRVDLSADGRSVLGITNLTPGGLAGDGNALDVHAAPESGPFAGTLWVASYGGGITILKPGSAQVDPAATSDVDKDGLNNSIDPFPVDATNGQSVLLTGGASLNWTFSQNEPHPGPSGLGNLGFTGVMTNGTQSYIDQYDPNKTIMGGAAAGVLMQDIAEGSPLTNNQRDAYQFGVDIGQDVGSYTITAKVNNPFDLVTPTDNQSVGFFIGTGDQANFIKLTMGSTTLNGVANSPTVDIVAESNDAIIAHQTLFAPVFGANQAPLTASDSILLEMVVDPILGTITPKWSITRGSGPNTGGEIFSGSGTAIQADGGLLAAIRGNHVISTAASGPVASGLAIGIIGSSDGPGNPFSATWNSIGITSTAKPDADAGAADLLVTPGAGIDVSTFEPSTIQIANLITSSKDLAQVVINLEDAILPDGAFFDPNASGGNNGKAFQINGATGSFTAAATYQNGSPQTGYNQITISFGGFNPGESVRFSLDIDPNSMLGYGKTVLAGGVSGAELAGSHVTFVFSDGSTTQADLFGSGIAEAQARGVANLHAAPVLSLQGLNSGNVTFPAGDPSILVHGLPGTTVRVQMMTVGQLNVPFESAFDGNSATGVVYETVTLDGAGVGVISGSLSVDQVLVVAAAEVNAQGVAISAVSPALRIIQQSGPLASVIGTEAGETLVGSDGDDRIEGRGGNDILSGLDGDDLINGGLGNDHMAGGAGDDSYVVDSDGDVVVEDVNAGLDTVRTVLGRYVLNANVENLVYSGDTNFTGTGNALANAITGARGADRLDGLAGADIMRGAAGNDTYVVDNLGDVVTESANQGTDRVLSQVNFTLSDNVENLQLTTSKAINGFGNASNNAIVGNAGVNILDGRGGSDTLTGGAGNDIFEFQQGEVDYDRITDFTGAGVAGGDRLVFRGYGADASLMQVGLSDIYVIDAGSAYGHHQEWLQLTGVKTLGAGDYSFASPPNLAPTSLSLSHQGVSENAAQGTVVGTMVVVDPDAIDTFTFNLLDDAGGRFALSGGTLVTTGPFDYEVAQSYSVVLEVKDAGGNSLQRAFSISIDDQNDNAVQFTSPASFTVNENDPVVGAVHVVDADVNGAVSLSILADQQDGELFTLVDGNVLTFASAPDFEAPHGPLYTVTLRAFDGVNTTEQLVSVSVTDIDESSPNSAPTQITLSNNVTNENAAAGSVVGILATVDADAGDTASFSLLDDGQGRFAIIGNQLVIATMLDYEAQQSYTVAVQARDSVGHTITRNFSLNVADVTLGDVKLLTSGDDDFTYSAGLSFDTIDAGTGIDSLTIGAAQLNLGATGQLLTLDLGSNAVPDFNATGVEQLRISGSQVAIAQSLAATALANGQITFLGTQGADLFDGANAGVKLSLAAGAGADILKGSAQADILDGGEGDDRMAGGAGDDIYIVDSLNDIVEEAVGAGFDSISTALASYTLGGNVEALVYTGTKAFTGTGNALGNSLSGGSGADRLDGAAGVDTLAGGLGNDTYVVDDSGDIVVELFNQGIDRVLSQASYTLSDNVENLQLSTSKALNGIGNALSNTLLGNGGINILDGRGGADILTGGGGNDIFLFQRGEAAGDKVTDFTGAGVAGGDSLKFTGYGADAFLSQIGTGDSYIIHAGAAFGGLTETIQIVGVTTLTAQDFLFA